MRNKKRKTSERLKGELQGEKRNNQYSTMSQKSKSEKEQKMPRYFSQTKHYYSPLPKQFHWHPGDGSLVTQGQGRNRRLSAHKLF